MRGGVGRRWSVLSAALGLTSVSVVVSGEPAAIQAAAAVSSEVATRFLYVASAFSPQISGFRIDAETGALTPVPGSPFTVPGPTGPSVAIALDPLGRFVFSTHAGDGTVWLLRIDHATGRLTPSGSAETGDFLGNPPAVDTSGRFVYAAGANFKVWGFSVDVARGGLRPLPGSPFPAAGEGGAALRLSRLTGDPGVST
jgi:6-phosphogluconolactonase